MHCNLVAQKKQNMNILVNHQITDPEAYWNALNANPPIPKGFKLLKFMAGVNTMVSACLWDAPNELELKILVDKTLGKTSKNSYMVINDTKSFDS